MLIGTVFPIRVHPPIRVIRVLFFKTMDLAVP